MWSFVFAPSVLVETFGKVEQFQASGNVRQDLVHMFAGLARYHCLHGLKRRRRNTSAELNQSANISHVTSARFSYIFLQSPPPVAASGGKTWSGVYFDAVPENCEKVRQAMDETRLRRISGLPSQGIGQVLNIL